MKTCTRCNKAKDLSEFYRHKGNRDGLRSHCKACHSAQMFNYYRKNKERIAALAKEYYQENRVRIIEEKTKYYKSNKEKITKRLSQYYKANKDKITKQKIEYNKTNRDKIAQQKAKYRKENKDKIAALAKEYNKANRLKIAQQKAKYRKANKDKIAKQKAEYCKSNPELCRAYSAKRRARKLNATPAWADLEAIKQFYMNCPEGYQVDHIIPLQGKLVCGLHVLNNLQYLTPEENIKKSNRLELSDEILIKKD